MQSWVNTHGQEAAALLQRSRRPDFLPISQQLIFSFLDFGFLLSPGSFAFLKKTFPFSFYFLSNFSSLSVNFSLPLWHPPFFFCLFLNVVFPSCLYCLCWVTAFLSQHTTESRWGNWAKLLFPDQHQAFRLLRQLMQMICVFLCVSVTRHFQSKLTSWPCIPSSPPSTSTPTQACML